MGNRYCHSFWCRYFYILFGRTIDKTKEELTSHITGKVIEYRIVEELQEDIKDTAKIVAQKAVYESVASERNKEEIQNLVKEFAKKIGDDTFADLADRLQKQTDKLSVSVSKKYSDQIIPLVEKQLAKIAEFDAQDVIDSAILPSGAVLAFSLLKCPVGWSLFEEGSGRVILGVGKGQGLKERKLLDRGGEEKHILTIGEMPQHNHVLNNHRNDKRDDGGFGGSENNIHQARGYKVGISKAGGNQPHNNMQPFVALRFCQKD